MNAGPSLPADARESTAALCLLKAGLIAVGLGLWFLTQAAIGARGLPGDAIPSGQLLTALDGLFALTEPFHVFLAKHPRWADGLLIVSSAVIDLMGIALIVKTVVGPSIRPFLGLLVLFALRQLCQALCGLPAPEGMIWRSPGVPSLLVTYQVANDFFFSGHTAIAVFAAVELCRSQKPGMRLLGATLALFEAATVIVLRAHYTMDVVTGVLAAFCAARAADRLAPCVDRFLARVSESAMRRSASVSGRPKRHSGRFGL